MSRSFQPRNFYGVFNVIVTMKVITAVLVVVMALAACDSKPALESPAADGVSTLSEPARGERSTDYEANWRLVSGYGPEGEVRLIDGADVSLIISGRRASGRAACNSYNSRFHAAGDSVRVRGGSMTGMACAPDVLESQEKYLSALYAASKIQRRGDMLILSGDGAELVFELVPAPPISELVGTRWELQSLIRGANPGASSTAASPAYLRLSRDGTFSGSTGCRELAGEWIENGYEILFTSMEAIGDCSEDLARQDGHVVGVLGDGFTVEVESGELTITDERKASGLLYRAADR